jgi:dihydrofolate synthase/folylpolyglutamate synthase
VRTAVLEVGLGGRLDATNVVDPLVTAIVSIALDHQTYLGSTVRQIAFEKAGIIKRGVPVIVGAVDREAYDAIAATARTRTAELIVAWDGVTAIPSPATTAARNRVHLRTPRHDYGEVEIGLRGTHQVANAIVAVRVLEAVRTRGVEVPPEAVVAGLANPEWPGRLELRRLPDGREALLDAAHNPAGAVALASYLEATSTNRPPVVFAVMRDKDVEGMLRALLPRVGPIFVTSASNTRSADPNAILAAVRKLAPLHPATIATSPEAALDEAWRLGPRVVVAGSIFLLADVMKALGERSSNLIPSP